MTRKIQVEHYKRQHSDFHYIVRIDGIAIHCTDVIKRGKFMFLHVYEVCISPIPLLDSDIEYGYYDERGNPCNPN